MKAFCNLFKLKVFRKTSYLPTDLFIVNGSKSLLHILTLETDILDFQSWFP